MPVGAVHCDRYRDTVRFRQQTAFDATFASIRRIGAGFFPLPMAPWSSHHPSPATTSQCHREHKVPVSPDARIAQTLPPGPTPGTVDGLSYSNKFRWHLTHSTGIPYAAQTRLHPSLHDRSPSGYARPADVAYVVVEAAPSVPTTHLANAIHRHFFTKPMISLLIMGLGSITTNPCLLLSSNGILSKDPHRPNMHTQPEAQLQWNIQSSQKRTKNFQPDIQLPEEQQQNKLRY